MKLSADHIATLYDRHGPEVLRYMARRTMDPEAAVDLMAETFARAITDRQEFQGDSEEEAVGWIYGIARHLLIDFIRRGRVERAAMQQLGAQRRPLNSEEHDRIEQLIDLHTLRDHVAAALDKLPRRNRDALRLRVLEDRTYAEVAAATGVSEQTARARVSRGLSMLRTTTPFRQLGEELGHV